METLKTKCLILIFLLNLIIPRFLSAALSGFITQDTVFTIDNSPYSVDGDLFIADGVTAIIKPGVTFQFKANSDLMQGGDYSDKSELIVYGTLIAEGKPDSLINFKSYFGSNTAGEWGQIKTDLHGKLYIKYATIKYGKNGLNIYNSAPMEIRILNCDFQSIETDAIIITGNNVLKSLVSANTFSSVQRAIYSSTPYSFCSNNSISNSVNGIRLSTNSIIESNKLNSLSGWGCSAGGSSIIINNKIDDISGDGIDEIGSNSYCISNSITNSNSTAIDISGSDNVRIFGNLINGSSNTGINFHTDADNNDISNNIIINKSSAVYFYSKCNENVIRYNTINSNIIGILLDRIPQTYYEYHLNSVSSQNNIISNNQTSGIADNVSSQIISNYDNVWNNGTDYYQVAPGDYSVSINPFFNDPNNGDLTLSNSSPCLNIGENGGQMGAYGGFRQYNHSPEFNFTNLNGGNLLADESIELQWTASDPDTDDVYIYLFWDTDNDTTEMTAIDLNLSNTGSYTWNTSRMLPGSYYIHAVAYDYKLGRTSEYSTAQVVITHDSNNETTPFNLTAYPSNQSVSLSWESPSSGTVEHYVIYQSTMSGFYPTVSDSIGKSNTTTYNVSGLYNGTTYYYRIAARRTDGNLTGFSNSVSVTPQSITIQVGSESSAPGASVSIPVAVTDMTGLGIISYQFEITFDSRFLNLGSITTTDCITGNWPAPSVNIGDSTVTVWHSGATELTGAGNLVNLEFTVNTSAAPGDSTEIRISDVLVNEGNPGYNYFNGWYSVYPAYSVSGTVQYYMGSHFLEGVSVSLSGAQTANTTTNASGEFTLSAVQGGWSYDVSASNAGILEQAISAYDAALILRHIALLDTLESNQLIAADVSGDGSVSSLDASNICQWGVELIDEFPSGKSWYMTPEVISIDPLTQDTSTINFLGIAYGDVSGNYDCNLGKNSGYPFVLDKDRSLIVEEPDEYRIELEKSAETIEGKEYIVYYINLNSTKGILAYTLKFKVLGGDEDYYNFTPSSDFTDHYRMTNYIKGWMIITSAGIYPCEDNGTNIGKIVLDSSAPEPWGDLIMEYAEINEKVVYVASSTGINDTEIILPKQYKLYQNFPNPFNRHTIIRYDLPKAVKVKIGIYDLNGRLIKSVIENQYINSGQYTFDWNGTDNSGNIVPTGIYFYRMDCSDYSGSKKMLFLK